MGVTYKISIDKSEVKDLVESLKKAGSKGQAVLRDEMVNAGEKVSREMRGKAPRATGTLADSIQVDQTEIRRNIIRIGPTVEYGLYQEEGSRGQSLPPISKIDKWARVKGLSDPSGRGSAAIFIARKIANVGYKAQKFVEKTVGYARNQFNNHIEIATQRIVTIIAKG